MLLFSIINLPSPSFFSLGLHEFPFNKHKTQLKNLNKLLKETFTESFKRFFLKDFSFIQTLCVKEKRRENRVKAKDIAFDKFITFIPFFAIYPQLLRTFLVIEWKQKRC